MKQATGLPRVSLLSLLVFLAPLSPMLTGASGLSFFGAGKNYVSLGAFALADFNGDGRLDLATSETNKKVVIRLNDGAGSFAERASLPGTAASYLAAGDFNNDGKMDVAYTGSSRAGVVLGAGDGTLRTVSETAVSPPAT